MVKLHAIAGTRPFPSALFMNTPKHRLPSGDTRAIRVTSGPQRLLQRAPGNDVFYVRTICPLAGPMLSRMVTYTVTVSVCSTLRAPLRLGFQLSAPETAVAAPRQRKRQQPHTKHSAKLRNCMPIRRVESPERSGSKSLSASLTLGVQCKAQRFPEATLSNR